VIVAHLLARVPRVDSCAPCSALAATSAMVKHRYRLFCGAASRSDHALKKTRCRGDPSARFRVPRRVHKLR